MPFRLQAIVPADALDAQCNLRLVLQLNPESFILQKSKTDHPKMNHFKYLHRITRPSGILAEHLFDLNQDISIWSWANWIYGIELTSRSLIAPTIPICNVQCCPKSPVGISIFICCLSHKPVLFNLIPHFYSLVWCCSKKKTKQNVDKNEPNETKRAINIFQIYERMEHDIFQYRYLQLATSLRTSSVFFAIASKVLSGHDWIIRWTQAAYRIPINLPQRAGLFINWIQYLLFLWIYINVCKCQGDAREMFGAHFRMT